VPILASQKVDPSETESQLYELDISADPKNERTSPGPSTSASHSLEPYPSDTE
jgi:hypothetical protein